MPQIDTLKQPFARNIKSLLILGILISCIMITTIGIINWLAFRNINQQVERLINETAVKTGLIYDMRIAARERNLHLAMSLLTTDPFLIDQHWQRLLQQGSFFLTARKKLTQLNLSEAEIALLKKQRKLSITTVRLQYKLHDQQLAGQYDKAIKVLNEEISMQVKVFSILDSILDLHKKNNQIIIDEIFISQKKTQKFITLLIIFTFTIIYLISAYLINRLSLHEKEIQNETIKYNALIEGSIDGIIVLDHNQVIDANKNALKLFGIRSLNELNKTGLDFYSLFSDIKHEKKDDGVFSAINYAIAENKKQYEWRFQNNQGLEFPADVVLQNIELDDNHYIQMIIRDVSDREAAKQALLDANKNLEDKVIKRTAELKITNTKMLDLARSAGMSEVASGVLHNVGNVLNSVNISAAVLKSKNTISKTGNIEKIAKILNENSDNINDYLKNDKAGKLLIPYIEQLSIKLIKEKQDQSTEIDSLIHNIEHIKNIISMQQNYAGNIGVLEKIMASDVANDAISINLSSINNSKINLSKYYDIDIELSIDKHKLIQILVNMISNAKHAVVNGGKADKDIILGIKKSNQDIIFYVEDNGIGISEEDQLHVFEFGFKKRAGGHGYGLHHSANTAKELGGSLKVESDGLDQGTTFTLTIPIL